MGLNGNIVGIWWGLNMIINHQEYWLKQQQWWYIGDMMDENLEKMTTSLRPYWNDGY